MELAFIIGTTAWFSTALVYKTGPFGIFTKLREWSFAHFTEQGSPLSCSFCTQFWVLPFVLILSQVTPDVIAFFGILGLASAVRGLSQEF